MSTLAPDLYGQTSPFDQIKRTNEGGAEYWSARELMPLLGYDRWDNFSSAIGRAEQTAINQGQPTATLFRGVTKKGAGRPQQDVELARFAAYLVAMNGDPRKAEVAAAQSYFAIRTREAEVARPKTLAERTAEVMGELDAMVHQQRAELEIVRPKAAQVDTYRQADGLHTIGDLANQLKVHAASNYPGVKINQQDVFDLAGHLGLIIRGNTVRKNQPTARAIEAGWVKPKETLVQTDHHGDYFKTSTRLTPKGFGRLWDAAVARLAAGADLKAVSA